MGRRFDSDGAYQLLFVLLLALLGLLVCSLFFQALCRGLLVVLLRLLFFLCHDFLFSRQGWSLIEPYLLVVYLSLRPNIIEDYRFRCRSIYSSICVGVGALRSTGCPNSQP